MRRVDDDRWLASRFASAEQRVRLIALYALNYEIARTAEVVHEPALGDIRFAWWRDALSAGTSSAHPVLGAFLAHWPEPEARDGVQRIIEARRSVDLFSAPFASVETMESYCVSTAGALIAVAARGCGGVLDSEFAEVAGCAWGLAGLLRAAPFWAKRGRSLLPEGASMEILIARAMGAYARARQLAQGVPPNAFAAFGYVTFAPFYLRGIRPGLLRRQVRLVCAAASGRL